MDAPAVSLTFLLAMATLLAGGLLLIVGRARRSPAQREQRRRVVIATRGRMGDATIIDVRGDLLIYEYSVRGVEYNASQDVSTLMAFLPEDRSLLIGQATLKYHPQNPANSILVCEFWSGLRKPVMPASQCPDASSLPCTPHV